MSQGASLGGYGISGLAEAFDYYGYSLCAGDFNGDGYIDLGVGVPLEDIGATSDDGAINVVYGSSRNLTGQGNQIYHQNSLSMLNYAEADDHFGFALTGGDFNGDRRCDIAIGVPSETINGVKHGAVQLLYGTASGVRTQGNS